MVDAILKQGDSPSSGKSHRFRYRHPLNKRFSIIGVVVVVVLAGVGGIFAYQKLRIVRNACTSSAAGNVLKQAAPNLFGNNQVALHAAVQKIKTLHDYQYDNNCDYVLAVYYTHAADFSQAQYYMNQYNKAGGLEHPLSSDLGVVYPDPTLIQKMIKERNFLW